jgi:PAS domain S-box-containing protein
VPHSFTHLTGLDVRAEDFLAAVLGAAGQPIWVVDRDDVIRFANPAALSALGYEDADELIGRHSHPTIHYEHPDGTPYPARDCPMALPRKTGETVARDQDWFFRRDGSMFPVSYVVVPLEMPDGRGAVVAFNDIEDQLSAERELRERDEILATQQASLQRVATLVARGAASSEVFAAIAMEIGQVIAMPMVVVWRYESDGTATVIGEWSDRPHRFRVGTRWPLDGPTITAKVLASGGPSRIEGFEDLPGAIAGAARETGIGSCAGAPIIVDGHLWGAMSVDTFDSAPLAEGIEDRLADFTALVAAAISNSASREALVQLANEQAALRRVATLVAEDVSTNQLSGAVVEEVGRLFGSDLAGMIRYESDGTVAAAATWAAVGEHPPVEGRWSLEGDRLATAIARTARPAREDDWGNASGPIAEFVRERLGIASSVGSPIVVQGRVWGALFVHSKRGSPALPAGTESRLMDFTKLVATATSNIEARNEVSRLAENQAALRRVATLVARGAPPDELWDATAEEVQRLFNPDAGTGLLRWEADGKLTLVGVRSPLGLRVGASFVPEEGAAALALKTGRPVRRENADPDPIPAEVPPFGSEGWRDLFRTQVATPILVEGQVWGVTVTSWTQSSPPPGIESQVNEFTELLATGISNAESRAELAASRARIVEAADSERRRVVRDLHDGAQQRLVHTVVTLKLARRALKSKRAAASALLGEALDHAQEATDELRELSHGIMPAVLKRGGLRSAIGALRTRMPVAVDVDVSIGRLPDAIEATAYFVVAEALTNVAKHAGATRASVRADVEDGTLRVRVQDDGVGGALSSGSGLVGLADRLAVVEGRLRIESPVDGGTLLAADIPLPP